MAAAAGDRGVALVERVIQALEDGGVQRLSGFAAPGAPVDEAVLASLRLPGGLALPPSLRRWLAYDSRLVRLFDDPARPVLRPLGFRQLLAQEFGGFASDAGWAAFDDLLPGTCYLLPGGTDARRFLYVGEPCPLGEYPVLCVDTHDVPFVCVYSPGFDVWLAEICRQLPGFARKTYTDLFDEPAYAAAMAEQARRNFGGFRALDEHGHDTTHLDGDAWREVTGVGSRRSALAAMSSFESVSANRYDDDDEETRPGDNPFTGRPRPRRHGF